MTFRAKFFSLNIQGFGGETKSNSVFEFAKRSNPDFVFLQETLAARPAAIDSLRAKWRGKSFWSPALGKQGGVAILVSENTNFELSQWMRDSSGRIVSVLARLGDQRYNFVNIYAPTNPTERRSFFDSLPDYFFPNSTVIVAGDFNCIESERDKFGGNVTLSPDLKDLHDIYHLVDIWRKTHGRQTQCTWFNSSKTIGSRLDKFFIAQNLVSHVLGCEIIPCVFSDHDSVNLILDLGDVFSHGPGLWRLNLDLLDDETFCARVEEIIGNHVLYQDSFPTIHEWWDFLKISIKLAAQEFSKRKQRKFHSEKVRVTNLLIAAKHDLIAGDESAKLTIDSLESELKTLHRVQNEAVKIRSRAKWLEEGEKPTKYFFKLESSRARKNSVNSVYNSAGVEVSSQPEIEQAHFDFYRALYSSEHVDPNLQQELLTNVNLSLAEHDIELCEGHVTLAEITRAVRGLSSGKTPGSDGFPQEFYLKFWALLGPQLVKLYNFSLEQGCFSQSMQGSVTRLIFKKDDPKHLKNWRPISLLNVDYKICSKALTNRLLQVLPSVIQEDQTCSIQGRTIFDNLALLRDTLDYVNITNETGILLSLDQEKAFDRVDRTFLSNVLTRFGFGPIFRRWISTLYCDATMQVLVNGFLTDQIPLERGVRQGDPLSPLLYVLCSEVLSCNIRSEPRYQGFLLPGAKGQQFKIRQYADDSTCFIKDLFSLRILLDILRKYEAGTGAKLNFSKTEAMWLGAWRTRSDKPLGLTWVTKMKILGIWFGNGVSIVEQDNWLPRLSKLENNLNLWKSRSLSLVGKSLIINVLGASKFWFLAKILSVPHWVETRFKKLVYHFLWNSKIETVSRQTLSAPVKEGGLGILDFSSKCMALKVSLVLDIATLSVTKDFFLLKYFIGSQLARLRPEWSHLRDNSGPSALTPTSFYKKSLKSITALEDRITDKSKFKYNSKNCYLKFLQVTVTAPLLPHRWGAFIGPGPTTQAHWSNVRDRLTENYKNDLAWLITLRGVKIRDSLRSWGYIATDACAHCHRKETIDHCFLNCKRARETWNFFLPTLSALLHVPFLANVKTVFFYLWPTAGDKNDTLARYVIKTILYGLWVFRNKATFHNGTETSRAIVRYISQDIRVRLKTDFSRVPLQTFSTRWGDPSLCKVVDSKLEIQI